jgi:hypothetical protein
MSVAGVVPGRVVSHPVLSRIKADRGPLQTVLILAAILLGGTLFNLVLLPNYPAGSPQAALTMNPVIFHSVEKALSTRWYDLLLPFQYEPGRFYWSPTAIFFFFWGEKFLRGTGNFLLFYNLFLVTAFACSLLLTRSRRFAVITVFMFAFGTQLDYLFTYGNLIALYLVLTYVTVNFTLLILYLQDSTTKSRYLWLFAASLAVTALSNEMWLNYATSLICATVFGILWSWRHDKFGLAARCSWAVAVVAAVLVTYLVIRMQVARQYVTPGAEEELIVTYRHWSLVVDDLFANFFTFLYTSISNYLPSFVSSSISLPILSPSEITASQNGYDQNYQQLVVMNHLFLWRFHAGVFVTLFLGGMAWTLRKSWSRPSGNDKAAIVVALGLMVLSGFSTHLMIKMRPYNSAPLAPYKVIMSVSAWTVLVAYVICLASDAFPRWRGWIIGGLLATVLVASLTRPGMHSAMMAQTGLAGYADPLPKLQRLWR